MGFDEVEKQEHSYVHELGVEVAYLNENKILKPSAYQVLFAQLAERHLVAFQADVNETMKYGLAWALVSMSIDVVRPIDHCMNLYAHTWFSQRKGPYFRRELVFCNDRGEVMFQGSTFSILLDVSTRGVFRKKELPFKLAAPREIFCTEGDPHFRGPKDFTVIATRKVYNSYIDCLGHVNNCRYGDFAYDALSDDEINRMGKLKRIEIYFISELRNKDQFTVRKAIDGNRIVIQGQNNTKGDTAFDFVFQF